MATETLDTVERRRGGPLKRWAAYLSASVLGLTAFAAGAVPAHAETSDDPSQAQAELLNLDALGLDILDAGSSRSGYPTDPGGDPQNIDVEALGALGLTLPGIDLPLLGESGLIDLGGDTLGAAGTWAQSPSEYESQAAVGLIGGDGAISTNVQDLDGYDFLSLDLTTPVNSLGVPTDGIIDAVALELGAIASEAEAADGEVSSGYAVAGAQLRLDTPLVGDLSSVLNEALGGVDETLEGLLGGSSALNEALGLLEVNIPVVGGVTVGDPEISVSLGTQDIAAPLLQEPITSESGLVALDLSTGQVLIDLAQLLDTEDGLNGLDPNTALISAETVGLIVSELNTLLTEDLVQAVTDVVQEAVYGAQVTIDLNPAVSLVGQQVLGATLQLDATLAQLAGLDDDFQASDILTFSVSTPLGSVTPSTLLNPLLNLLSGTVLPALTQPVLAVVDELPGALGETITGVTTPVLEGISPVLELLESVVTIRVNDQPTEWEDPQPGYLGEGSFSVSALTVDVLNLGAEMGAVTLPLATSSVLAQDPGEGEEPVYDPSITVPEEAAPGDEIDIIGEGFDPELGEVGVVIEDEDGNRIELGELPVDENGDIDGQVTLPEDLEDGDHTIIVTDPDTGEDLAEGPINIQTPDPGGEDEVGTGDESIAVDPDTIAAGESTTVTGEGFEPGSVIDIEVRFDDTVSVFVPGVEIDEQGGFSEDVEIPADRPAGEYTVVTVDPESGTELAETGLTVTEADTPGPGDLSPALEADPAEVEAGGQTLITGSDFTQGSAPAVLIPAGGGEEIQVPPFTVGEDGTIEQVLNIAEDIEPGTYTLQVTDPTYEENTASVELLITAASDDEEPGPGDGDDDDDDTRNPGIVITPNPVDPGEEIVIEGDDHEPGSEVDVIIEDEDGNVIIEVPGVEVDEDGGFEITVPIPEDTEPGDYTVIVEDPETGERIAEEEFTVNPPEDDSGDEDDEGTGPGDEDEVIVDPSFRVSPETVEQGGYTVGVGGGWEPGSTVTLQLTDGSGSPVGQPVTVTVDEDGLFTQPVHVPADAAPGGYVVTATDGERTESHPLTVEEASGTGPGDSDDGTGDDGTGEDEDPTDPREEQPGPEQPGAPGDGTPGIITDPTNPYPGEEIDIIGEDFDPELDEVGVVIEDEDGNRTDLGQLPVDEDGNIGGSVTIPEDTVPGDYTIIVTDPETGEDIAEAPIRVIDPDYGQDDDEDGAGDEGEEPVERDPEIAISPNEVEAGQSVAVGGGHWTPGSSVTVVITDAAGSPVGEPVTLTADEEGLIQGILTVPEGTAPGDYTVVAGDGAGNTASEPLRVLESATPPDDGEGDGDDDGTGDDGQTPDPESDPSLNAVVGSPEIHRSETQTVTVTGVEPGTEVLGVSDDEGTVEREHTAMADEDGRATFEWTIPQESEHREHVFTAEAEGYEGTTATYTVTPYYDIEVELDVKYIGDEQVGTAWGYTPGTEVQAYMNSYPTIDLGTQVADENGVVTFTWTTPDHTEPGWHTFSAHADGKPDLAVQFYVSPGYDTGGDGTGADGDGAGPGGAGDGSGTGTSGDGSGAGGVGVDDGYGDGYYGTGYGVGYGGAPGAPLAITGAGGIAILAGGALLMLVLGGTILAIRQHRADRLTEED